MKSVFKELYRYSIDMKDSVKYRELLKKIEKEMEKIINCNETLEHQNHRLYYLAQEYTPIHQMPQRVVKDYKDLHVGMKIKLRYQHDKDYYFVIDYLNDVGKYFGVKTYKKNGEKLNFWYDGLKFYITDISEIL